MQQWSFNFGPGFVTPEEMKAWQEQQEKDLQNKINEKYCIVCENAALVNDQIAFCNVKSCERSGMCVNDLDGKKCEFWSPIIKY